MTPTTRLTSIVVAAAFAIGGAGLALASVGAPPADPAAASDTVDTASDPAAMKALNHELARLDKRSNKLHSLLGDLKSKTRQVSARTVALRSAASGSDDYSSPSSSPSTSPSPQTTHSDHSDDSYNDDQSYDDDSYESDDDSYESDDGYGDEGEHEDGGADD
jgi:hypothetical protein